VSQANIERVRSAVEAWNRRDADLWTEHAAPDVEWIPAGPAAVEGTVYRGYDEVVRGLEAVWQTWDVVSFEESEVRALDDEGVLWLGRLKLRGASSHVELDQEFAVRFSLREGKLVTVQAFIGWQRALDAVGLAG
jgi:ketosteroid isomerase-like protein